MPTCFESGLGKRSWKTPHVKCVPLGQIKRMNTLVSQAPLGKILCFHGAGKRRTRWQEVCQEAKARREKHHKESFYRSNEEKLRKTQRVGKPHLHPSPSRSTWMICQKSPSSTFASSSPSRSRWMIASRVPHRSRRKQFYASKTNISQGKSVVPSS